MPNKPYKKPARYSHFLPYQQNCPHKPGKRPRNIPYKSGRQRKTPRRFNRNMRTIRLKRRGVFRKLRKGLLAQLAGTLAQVSSMMPFAVFFDGKAGAPHRFHHQNVSDYGHYRG